MTAECGTEASLYILLFDNFGYSDTPGREILCCSICHPESATVLSETTVYPCFYVLSEETTQQKIQLMSLFEKAKKIS